LTLSIQYNGVVGSWHHSSHVDNDTRTPVRGGHNVIICLQTYLIYFLFMTLTSVSSPIVVWLLRALSYNDSLFACDNVIINSQKL